MWNLYLKRICEIKHYIVISTTTKNEVMSEMERSINQKTYKISRFHIRYTHIPLEMTSYITLWYYQ